MRDGNKGAAAAAGLLLEETVTTFLQCEAELRAQAVERSRVSMRRRIEEYDRLGRTHASMFE